MKIVLNIIGLFYLNSFAIHTFSLLKLNYGYILCFSSMLEIINCEN